MAKQHQPEFSVRPKRPIQPRALTPELAQVLARREQQRSPSIQEQCREIHARVEMLRAATYLLLLKLQQQDPAVEYSRGPGVDENYGGE